LQRQTFIAILNGCGAMKILKKTKETNAKKLLTRRALHKSAILQFCHPDPFGKLRTGSVKDHGFFIRSVEAFDKSRFFSSRRIRRSFRMTMCGAFVNYAKVSLTRRATHRVAPTKQGVLPVNFQYRNLELCHSRPALSAVN
jgi:hypothetical protein